MKAKNSIAVIGIIFGLLHIALEFRVLAFLCLFFTAVFLAGRGASELVFGLWTKLARFLGKVNAAIVLFLIFYLCLTPIAVLYRIFNRKAAEHFVKKRIDTYFTGREHSYAPEDFEKMW
ncbi:MAG: hypothetical protein JW803_04415 [Endomicrobiales bacterium]|nr:hypothetical protein [Endomicrobiales bacterium]